MVSAAVGIMTVMPVGMAETASAAPNPNNNGHTQDISKYPKKNWMYHYTNQTAYNGIVSSGHLGLNAGSCPDQCNFMTPTVYSSGAQAKDSLALPSASAPTLFIPIPPGQAMPPGQRPPAGQAIVTSALPPGQQKRGYAGNTPAAPNIDNAGVPQNGGGTEFKKNVSFSNPNGKPIYTTHTRGAKQVPIGP